MIICILDKRVVWIQQEEKYLEILTILFQTLYKSQTFAAKKEKKKDTKNSLNFKIVEERWIFNPFWTNCSYLK